MNQLIQLMDILFSYLCKQSKEISYLYNYVIYKYRKRLQLTNDFIGNLFIALVIMTCKSVTKHEATNVMQLQLINIHVLKSDEIVLNCIKSKTLEQKAIPAVL